MRRMFALRVLLTLALIAAVVSIALAKPYISSRGYQITPAQGWQINSQGLYGTDLVIIARPSDGFRANLNVILRPLPGGMGLQQLRSAVNNELRMLNDYKQVSQSNTFLGGTPAVSTVAKHESDPTLYMHQIAVIKNGAVYTFTCTALAANHAKYEAPFASMLKSIKWHAPKPGKQPH